MSHVMLKKVVNTESGPQSILELAPLEVQTPLIALLETERTPDPEMAAIIDEIGVLHAMNPYTNPDYDPMEEWLLTVWGM